MNSITNKVIGNLIENDKIKLPEWVKKVKIDVGLSHNAPNSRLWFDVDENICVFGFEPNAVAINILESNFKDLLSDDNNNKKFFLINCALSDEEPTYRDFFITKEDMGTSSLYKPNFFELERIDNVSVITLKEFFNYFPWDKVETIEHLKIDTQGNDLKVLKGCGEYLNKVIFVTVEVSTNNQYEIETCGNDFDIFMEGTNFIKIREREDDYTYFNTMYENIVNKNDYRLFAY